jgi:hypothetical protein
MVRIWGIQDLKVQGSNAFGVQGSNGECKLLNNFEL